MASTFIMDTHHPDYDNTIDAVYLVRDTIDGENAIKNGPRANSYLPDPTDSESKKQDSKSAKARYNDFKMRAEYDGFPSRTQSGYMGALKFTAPVFEMIPTEIEYLLSDSDGDGLTLNESIEVTQGNLLEVKFHGLLSDFNGLTENDTNEDSEYITNARAKELGLKATIKHYPRESIVDWDYGVVNNQNQLTFVKLSEKSSEIDRSTFQRTVVENQLILALDEEGFYYQVQITKDDEGKETVSEMRYPENNTGKMPFIPFEVVIDQKSKSSYLPKALGIIYPISLKAISRYQVKADLKESIHQNAQPTLKTSGWTEQKNDLFKKMNGGDTMNLGSGGGVHVPDGVTAEYLQWDADSDASFKYLEMNEKEAKALGGRFDTSDPKDEAVGVAKIRSAEELSSLVNIQTSTQESYIRVMTWCYHFMSINTNTPEIELTLNKEFNKIKLTAQEQAAVLSNFNLGLIDREEALAQLYHGGILTVEAEVLLKRAESNGE